jgi:hypothetical protein
VHLNLKYVRDLQPGRNSVHAPAPNPFRIEN